jgi:hypothetical protein
MSTHRTAWHFFFVILLRKCGPRWLEVREEVPLSEEPPRLYYLFLRKLERGSEDDVGQTLRGLWPRLPKYTVAELKTVGRPYGARGLQRLWIYLYSYFVDPEHGVESHADLAGVLIVPSRTPTLLRDAKDNALDWNDLEGGYWELAGGPFKLYVAEIDIVAEREDDDLLRLFGHGQERTLEARRFWAEQVGTKEAMMAVRDLEEYDEVVQKFVELLPPEKVMRAFSPSERVAGLSPSERVAGLAPSERVAGLAPSERVAGLAPEDVLLALPDEILCGLSEDFVARLPEATRSVIRKRLGR